MAYNGYTKSAKIAATKHIQSTVKNSMSSTFALCQLNETILLGSTEYSCNNAQESWCSYFSKYFQNELGFKNPFNTKQKTVLCSKSYTMPRGFLLDIGQSVIVYSPDQYDRYLRIYSNLGRDEKDKFIILEDKIYNENKIY